MGSLGTAKQRVVAREASRPARLVEAMREAILRRWKGFGAAEGRKQKTETAMTGDSEYALSCLQTAATRHGEAWLRALRRLRALITSNNGPGARALPHQACLCQCVPGKAS